MKWTLGSKTSTGSLGADEDKLLHLLLVKQFGGVMESNRYLDIGQLVFGEALICFVLFSGE